MANSYYRLAEATEIALELTHKEEQTAGLYLLSVSACSDKTLFAASELNS